MGNSIDLSRGLALTAAMLTAAFAAAPASAAPVPADGRTEAVLVSPLSLVKTQDMSFGDIAAGATAGTVIIDPDTGARTVTGGVIALGGEISQARFTGAGSADTQIAIIKEPAGSIMLIRSGGTETMVLDNFTLDGGGSTRLMSEDRVVNFAVGGTLNVNANQVDGVYDGTFTVTIEYQ